MIKKSFSGGSFPRFRALGAFCLSVLVCGFAGVAAEAVDVRLASAAEGASGPPYQSGVDASGVPSGFDAAVFEAAALSGGVAFHWTSGDSEEAAPADVVAGVPCREGGLAGFEYCLAHTELEYGLFKSSGSLVRSLADMRGKKIVVVEGSDAVAYLQKRGFGANLVMVADAGEALSRVRSGDEEEAALIEKQSAERALDKSGMRGGVARVPGTVHAVEYGFAVASGQETVRNALEEGMRVLKRTGQYDQLAESYFGAGVAPSSENFFVKAYSYSVWVLLPITLLLAAAVFHFFSLRQNAVRKVRELQIRLGDVVECTESLREEQAKQRFVINRLSAVSLVDQVLSVSRSRDEEQPQELHA